MKRRRLTEEEWAEMTAHAIVALGVVFSVLTILLAIRAASP